MSIHPPAESNPRPLILVVEDHPDTQSLVAEHLRQNGFEVALASDGVTAMELIRERRPELVYLDLNLPHISGYDVCEQVRADPDLKDVAILMTSARTTVDVRAFALEAGADAYLPKPYDLEELTSHIEQLSNWEKAPTRPLQEPLCVPARLVI
jgi:DNA-binding response OmpR family regulator